MEEYIIHILYMYITYCTFADDLYLGYWYKHGLDPVYYSTSGMNPWDAITRAQGGINCNYTSSRQICLRYGKCTKTGKHQLYPRYTWGRGTKNRLRLRTQGWQLQARRWLIHKPQGWHLQPVTKLTKLQFNFVYIFEGTFRSYSNLSV